MNKYLIEVKKIKKNFIHKNGKIEIFKSVSLGIKKGELVAVVGPSGSGKSSFLHLLALLDEPSAGQVYFQGKDTKNISEEEKDELRRRRVSIIFQDNNLLSDFTTIENVSMPLIIRGEKYSDSKNKAKKVLKSPKISEKTKSLFRIKNQKYRSTIYNFFFAKNDCKFLYQNINQNHLLLL